MINLVDHTVKAMDLAERHLSDLDEKALQVAGMSSSKVRHLLNNLTKFNECRYLEIGCWKGSTTVSALYRRNPDAYWVIDCFSEFNNKDNPGEGADIKGDFIKNFKHVVGGEPNLIDNDCFKIKPLQHGISGVNVYFYDGNHGDESHKGSLMHYANAMADTFVYIVDDWDGWNIKKVTYATIEEMKLKTLFKAELPQNSETDKDQWWGGIGVFVLQK